MTGDLARRDHDGYFWFIGRADDVIKSSGHLISPFEVESALMEHPAVAEVGVIGMPDPIAGQAVKAFVDLRNRVFRRPRNCVAAARPARALGAAVAPREIDFSAALPRTRSGKIMRRLLKARELGLPEAISRRLRASDMNAKVHLDIIAHVRSLADRHAAHPPLRGKMLRTVQRNKIRGFMHLYDGEEAVAVGVIGAASARTRIVSPTASTARRWRAALAWMC